MKHRRVSIILLGTVGITIFGGMAIFWLNDKCPTLPPDDCKFMWGTMMASILGGVLFTEMLLGYQKTRHEKQPSLQDSQTSKNEQFNEASSTNWYVWFRPVAWVTLSSLLAGLPLIAQGAVALTISGTAIGFCFDGLMRGILNRLPPMAKDS